MSIKYDPIENKSKPTPIKTTFKVTGIATLFYMEHKVNFGYRGEYHNFWEMVYVDAGKVIARAEDKEYPLHKGDLIFHKPNEKHRMTCDESSPGNVFIITFECKSPAMKLFENRIMKLPNHLDCLIYSMIEEFQAAFGENTGNFTLHPKHPFGFEQMIRNYLEILLIQLSRTFDEQDKKMPIGEFFHKNITLKKKLVTDVIAILENGIYDRLTINDVCQRTNYAKSQLCKTFKDATGKSIMQYYNTLRIRQAKLLLRTGNMTNESIAETLGFSSPQYFVQVFRRMTGFSPGDYKNSVKPNYKR